MSHPNSNLELEVAFEFEIKNRKYRGVMTIENNARNMYLEISSINPMRPVDLEKALYQVAHVLAEKTSTLKQFKQEKLDVWN